MTQLQQDTNNIQVVKTTHNGETFTKLMNIHKVREGVIRLRFDSTPKYCEDVWHSSFWDGEGTYTYLAFVNKVGDDYVNEEYTFIGLKSPDLVEILPLKHEYQVFLFYDVFKLPKDMQQIDFEEVNKC